jgi:hypothetical protein
MRNASRAAVAALAVCACASLGGPEVRKTDVVAPPKPPGCGLEVLRKRPARPYDTLGTVTSHLTSPPKDPLSIVTPTACELGADAIIVDQNMVLNELGHVLVSVTAIRWRAEAAAATAPPAEVPPTPATTVTTPAPAAPEQPAQTPPATTVTPPAPAAPEQPAQPPRP